MQAQNIKSLKVTELSNYIQQSDHPLVVNFWATFCVPCVKEMPYFEKVVAQYKTQNVELLLVSLDVPEYYPAKIQSFVKDKNLTSPIIWLNERNADYFCPKIDRKWSGGIPSTLFVNPKTGHRKFFESELSATDVDGNIKLMLAGSSSH